ncbi:hypothetical protein [Saccharothrix sp.]|nr:hypothetical protein [Saccharothrix sp.]
MALPRRGRTGVGPAHRVPPEVVDNWLTTHPDRHEISYGCTLFTVTAG